VKVGEINNLGKKLSRHRFTKSGPACMIFGDKFQGREIGKMNQEADMNIELQFGNVGDKTTRKRGREAATRREGGERQWVTNSRDQGK
jgi:hypothetical protein